MYCIVRNKTSYDTIILKAFSVGYFQSKYEDDDVHSRNHSDSNHVKNSGPNGKKISKSFFHRCKGYSSTVVSLDRFFL